jgi:DNA polymerase III delta prime subunit
MITKQLWTEAYRPKTISEYVFVDDRQKQQIEQWIKDGSCPNLLLSGGPGTGKSTLAKVLINELGVNLYDVLEINASRENSVSTVREKLNNFAQTMPFGIFKVIFLDEADALSAEAQKALRSDMEAYHETVRYIFTCNYPHQIIPALKSRCHELAISKTDLIEFTTRAATVLVSEGIEFELDVLDTYVRATYPDLRKCLSQLQENSSTGTLLSLDSSSTNVDELLTTATGLFKSGKILEGRQQLLQYIGLNPGKVEEIYKWMYTNLDLWGKTNEQKDAAIIIIRNGLASLPMVAIPEIAIAASMIELTTL